ncbi:MAG: hypothetical protein ABW192_01040, partial [Sphingobium sp.]
MPSSPRLLIVLLGLFAMASPASARWTQAHSPNFIVYSEGSETSLRESILLLEDYDRLLRTLTGTDAPPSPRPLPVYLLGSQEEMHDLFNVPRGAVGFYYARSAGIAAFAVRSKELIQGLAGRDVLLHEYAHHFMNSHYPAYYPAWYSEGFAEYVMTAKFLPDRIEIGRVNISRALSLVQSPWISTERIFATGKRGLAEIQMPQFYAESWLIVHYLFAAPERREALTRYLADLNRGVAEDAAFTRAFGMDHRTFDTALKRYRDGGLAYGTMARAPGAAPAVGLTLLPQSADGLLLREQALVHTPGTDERLAENN